MSSNLPITREEFLEAMPTHVRKNVTDEVITNVNNALKDPEVLAVYRENVIGLSSVMKEGKFKLADYLAAVKYVSYKLLGGTNIQAWSKTFPERYQKLIQRNMSRTEIAAVCSRYNSSKLVTLLMEQTLVPTHILNAPVYQQAINKLADLMMNAKSEKVQSDSAGKLIDALKPPETKKIELDVAYKEDSSVEMLRETTMALVRQQREMIEKGVASVKGIAESRIIDITPDEETEYRKLADEHSANS